MTKICLNCKEKNRDSANFCEKCGSILNSDTPIKNKSKINNSPVRWFKKQNTVVKIVGFCFILILILGIVKFLFIFIQTYMKVHHII